MVIAAATDYRRLADRAVEAGAKKVVPLAVAGAFHTPLMDPAVESLREALPGTVVHFGSQL